MVVRPHDRPSGLPHDLVHYVVERELGLAWGFWGLVAAEASIESVRRLDGKQPRWSRDGQKLLKEHRDHTTQPTFSF